MMDSRILEHPHAQFGGMVGFPYPLGHHHVYELAGHQLQSAAASVPFSIDGLLSGSCAASVVNPAPLIPSGCGVSGDSQPFKLAGRSGPVSPPSPHDPITASRLERVSAEEEKHRAPAPSPLRTPICGYWGARRQGRPLCLGYPRVGPTGWSEGGSGQSAGSIPRSYRRGATRVP